MNSEIKRLIDKSLNIIVFTGAGISTNSGISDFRSEGGLYEIVGEKYNLPYPEAIFEIDYFRKNPKPFYDLSKNLLSETSQPTDCHKYLARLEEAGKRLQIITQNIDHLHQRAGSQNVLECHGSYEHGHCLDCQKRYVLEEYDNILRKGEIPYCGCGGYIKPDIVFFGEQLPIEFYNYYEEWNQKGSKKSTKTDLILILGTSLKVQPAAGLALMIAEKVPSIIVNKDRTDFDNRIDYVVHEDLDVFSRLMESIQNKGE